MPIRTAVSRMAVLAGVLGGAGLLGGAGIAGALAPHVQIVATEGPSSDARRASAGPAIPDPARRDPEKGHAQGTTPPGPFLEIPLRARDGHEFQASYYASATRPSGPGILLIPNLGHDRGSLSGLSAALAARGYSVLAMDNVGHLRNVTRGHAGLRKIKPLDRKLFDRLALDVPPAFQALRSQPGVPPKICAIGFGVGANLALQFSVTSPEIGALALVMPGYGCEEFDSPEALSQYGKRPLVMIESQKRVESDLARTFKLLTRTRNDGLMERIVLPREPGHVLTDLGSGQEGTDPLVEWLVRIVPAGAP